MSGKEKTKEEYNRITEAIIGAAVDVHRQLGPGLLESAYEACLAYEIAQRGMKVERQKELPLTYREVRLDAGYRIDLLVDDCVVVEVKAVEHSLPVHEVQVLTYLRLSGNKVGLLINFNVRTLVTGIRRVVNGLPE
jgi:GxxExxY protein